MAISQSPNLVLNLQLEGFKVTPNIGFVRQKEIMYPATYVKLDIRVM
jgi:hypothetical protein